MATGWWKRHIGLDFVDTAIHVVITICAAIAVAEAATGPDEGGVVAVTLATSALVFGWRRNRARRQAADEPETTGEVQAQRVYELESRVAELEFGQQRMQELEERLDFAERLLAQRAEPARLEEPR